MQFNDLMKALGERLGGEIDLTPDESGVVNLMIDDLQVMIMPVEELSTVILYSLVATPPPEAHHGRLYEALLKANCVFTETYAATLSLDVESGGVFLCKALPADPLEGPSLEKALRRFVIPLMKWKKIVADIRDSPIGSKAAVAGYVDQLAQSDFIRV